jgi:hypothetical protein
VEYLEEAWGIVMGQSGEFFVFKQDDGDEDDPTE